MFIDKAYPGRCFYKIDWCRDRFDENRERKEMRSFIAFWSILLKDMKNYYLKPPNISW